MKALVVTKDITGFQMFAPVVKLLRDDGIEVHVVAEGLSLDLWIKNGEQVVGGIPAADQVDPNTKIRTDIDVDRTIMHTDCNIILCELGAPIHLAEEFALAANERDITLGFVLDLWGVQSRSKAIPDFVCVFDEAAAEMVRKHEAYKQAGKEPKVIVTGSPAYDTLPDTAQLHDVNRALSAFISSFDRTILIAGQDESTTPLVEGVVEGLNEIEAYCLIIPRFHPKIMNNSKYSADVEAWERALRKSKHSVLRSPEPKDTDILLGQVDITVSIYSNVLVKASMQGGLAVSYMSEIGRQKMAENLGGLRSFPPVSYGAMIEVESAREFVDRVLLTDAGHVLDRSKEFLPNDGKAARRVADAIQSAVRRI